MNPGIRRTVHLLVVVHLFISITSCGTSHQFLPSRALEKEDWQISLSWHYNFNKLSRIKVIPDVNAYMGIGDRSNIGFGAQIPFSVSHLSFAKYYGVDASESWVAYAHINQFFLGMNDNPFLEFGGMYSKDHGDLRQNFSIGMSFGLSHPWPLLITKEQVAHSKDVKPRLYFMPTIKWQLSGNDIGVSVINYIGLARDFRKDLINRIVHENDTIAIFVTSLIDSIVPGSASPYICYNGAFTIYFKSGHSALLCAGDAFSDIFPRYPDVFVNFVDKYDRWLGSKYKLYTIFPHNELAILDSGEVFKNWRDQEYIIIPRYSPTLLRKVGSPIALLKDISIGVAIFDNDN